jgi:hypothetical protein
LSLRRRITNALEELEPKTREFLLGPWASDTTRFVGHIVDGRNYLTHYPTESKARRKRLRGPELSMATSRVRALTVQLLFKSLGFDEHEVVKRLTESESRFQPAREAWDRRKPGSTVR